MSSTIACVQKNAVAFGETLISPEGLNKTAKLGSVTISFVGKILGTIADGWNNFNGVLRSGVEFLDFVDIISRITEWVKGEVKGGWKIASRIFLTAYRVLSVVSFLEKLKLFDLGPTVERLSRIPVIGLLVNIPLNVIGLISFSLSTVHNSIEVHKDNAKLILATNKLAALQLKQQLISDPAQQLEDKYVDSILKIRAAKVTLGKLPSVDNSEDAIAQIRQQWQSRTTGNVDNAKLTKDIKKADLRISVAKTERGRTLLGLINDVLKVAVISLSLVGLAVGGILASTSIPMLVLGLVVAGVGFYKVFHDKYAKMSIESTKKQIKET